MRKGDSLRYRSLSGDVWPAEVCAACEDGTLDIQVIIHPEERLHLTRIPFLDHDDGTNQKCFA